MHGVIRSLKRIKSADIGQFYAGHKLLAVVKTAEVFVTNLRRRSEVNQAKVTLALLLDAVQMGKKIVR